MIILAKIQKKYILYVSRKKIVNNICATWQRVQKGKGSTCTKKELIERTCLSVNVLLNSVQNINSSIFDSHLLSL